MFIVQCIVFAVLEAYFASWVENIINVHVSITNKNIANDSLQVQKLYGRTAKPHINMCIYILLSDQRYCIVHARLVV